MAGVVGALIIAKTQLTQRQAANGIGTAAQWPSARGVRGLIAQSLPQGTHRSSAFMQVGSTLSMPGTRVHWHVLQPGDMAAIGALIVWNSTVDGSQIS